MRALLEEAGMQDSVVLDSAGTGAWHVGSAPDERASAAARGRGVVLKGAARKVTPRDFEEFDLLLAMDGENLSELRRMAADERQREKIRLLREFDPAVAAASAPSGGATAGGPDLDVPDPYYGAAGGFDEVFELVQAACEGLLEEIRAGRAP
jgi:protein-tyrosine phosphatase